MDQLRGVGRAILAAVFLMIGGVLNIIYGIAAIGSSHVFTHNTPYVFASLKGWGWVTLIIGILELLAAFLFFGGGTFRPMVWDLRGQPRGDRRVARDPGLSALGAGDLRAKPMDHSWVGCLWRGRLT